MNILYGHKEVRDYHMNQNLSDCGHGHLQSPFFTPQNLWKDVFGKYYILYYLIFFQNIFKLKMFWQAFKNEKLYPPFQKLSGPGNCALFSTNLILDYNWLLMELNIETILGYAESFE